MECPKSSTGARGGRYQKDFFSDYSPVDLVWVIFLLCNKNVDQYYCKFVIAWN